MERSRIQVTRAVLVGAACLLLGVQSAGARSAADLSSRLVMDGVVDDWDPADRVFRSCAAPSDSCTDEEPIDDSVWSALQELRQIYVTWDARNLYLAVTGRIVGHALVLCLDLEDGERRDLTSTEVWRRALRFGPALSLDAFVAVRDGQRQPELWRLPAGEALEPVDPANFVGAAAFDAATGERGLEISIPWDVLFPGSERAVNSDSLAPEEPMFVLPPAAARHGLRLVAAVVHANEGLGAADLAPDGFRPLEWDARTVAVADRAVRVEWSDPGAAAPQFVRFGFAIQEQASPRFVPDVPDTIQSVTPGGFEVEMSTERAESSAHEATRVVVPDRGLDIAFALHVRGQAPDVLYASSRILSLRGESIVELATDVPVSCSRDGTACRSPLFRWDGRDATGAPAPGGYYVWRVDVGASPGTRSHRLQHTIAVVH